MRLGTGDPVLISAYTGHPATLRAAVAAEPAMKSRRRMRPPLRTTPIGDDSTFWHGRARHARCSATAVTACACAPAGLPAALADAARSQPRWQPRTNCWRKPTSPTPEAMLLNPIGTRSPRVLIASLHFFL